MPALSSPSTWRTKPFRGKYYASIWTPETVYSCLVNQGAFSYPIGSITVDNASGSASDVLAGMTIKVEDSTGVFKGYLRVRSLSGSTLTFGAVSNGEINFENNDQITIWDDFRIWSIVPYIDTEATTPVLYKDRDVAYTNQGERLPPVCVAGGPRVGFVDSVSGKATFAFDLTDSYHVASDASGISTYASATLPSGVSVASGSVASGSFSLECDAGQYVLHFTVTDDLGTTHTAHVPVLAHDTSSNAPNDCIIQETRATLDEGWTAVVRVLDTVADYDAIPRGTMVIVWGEESYGGVSGSLNGLVSGQEHIQFVGWIRDVANSIEPEVSDVVLQLGGPFDILAQRGAYSQSVETKDSPTAWQHVKDLTAWRAIMYMIQWHSTLADVCDVREPSWANTYPIPDRLDFDPGDLVSQLNFAAVAVAARVSSDRLGALLFNLYPHAMSAADRTSLTTTVTLANTDWSEQSIQITENDQPKISWLRGAAIKSQTSGIEAMLSIAPGSQPAQGGTEDARNQWLCVDQTELNRRTGHAFAEATRTVENVTFQILNGGLVVDPAWQEWIKVNLAATMNKRGIAYDTNTRWTLREIATLYDHETGTTLMDWTLVPEASGQPGVTVQVPRFDEFSYPAFPELPPYRALDFTVYDPTFVDESHEYVLYPNAKAIFMCDNRYLYKSTEPDNKTGGPNWTTFVDILDNNQMPYPDGLVAGSTYNPRACDFKLDPWAPEYRGWLSMVEINAASTHQCMLFEITNILSDTPTVTYLTHVNHYTLYGWDANLQASINHEGVLQWAYVVAGTFSNGVRVIASDDYGATWTSILGSDGHNPNYVPKAAAGLEHFSDSAATMKSALVGGYYNLNPPALQYYRIGFDGAPVRITDIPQTVTFEKGTALNVPYMYNGAENPDLGIVYVGYGIGGYYGGAGNPEQYSVWRVSDFTSAGRVWTNITPQISGTYYPMGHYSGDQYGYVDYAVKKSLWSDTYEGKTMIVSEGYNFLRTNDGGSTWELINLGGNIFNGVGGWPYDPTILFAWGYQGAQWSDDGGTTWYDLAGSLGTASFVNTFVPIWT